MFCDEPPPKPHNGKWIWAGNTTYGTTVEYSCGVYAKFQDPTTKEFYDSLTTSCQWNKTWTRDLDPCIGGRTFYFSWNIDKYLTLFFSIPLQHDSWAIGFHQAGIHTWRRHQSFVRTGSNLNVQSSVTSGWDWSPLRIWHWHGPDCGLSGVRLHLE